MHFLFKDKSQKNTWVPSVDDKKKCWHIPSTDLKESLCTMVMFQKHCYLALG